MDAKFLLKNDAGTRLHPVRCPSRVNKKDMFVAVCGTCSECNYLPKAMWALVWPGEADKRPGREEA